MRFTCLALLAGSGVCLALPVPCRAETLTLKSAQVAMANAGHDYIVAAYKVLWATGQLPARGLALKLRDYDPHRHYEQDTGAWRGLGD